MLLLAAIGAGALVGLIVSRLLALRPEPAKQAEPAPTPEERLNVQLTFEELEHVLAPYEHAA